MRFQRYNLTVSSITFLVEWMCLLESLKKSVISKRTDLYFNSFACPSSASPRPPYRGTRCHLYPHKTNTFSDFWGLLVVTHQLRHSNCFLNRFMELSGKQEKESLTPCVLWKEARQAFLYLSEDPTSHRSTCSVACPLGPWGPARLQQKLLLPDTLTPFSPALSLFHPHSSTIA